jgi:hypothetical protein
MILAALFQGGSHECICRDCGARMPRLTHSCAFQEGTKVVSSCVRCGAPFKKRRSWARFCSSRCRVAAWEGR